MSTTEGWLCGRRWVAPGVCAVAALAYLGAGLAGGDTVFAWAGFGIMIVFGAGMLLAGRFSETARGLLDHKDERINSLDRDASLIAGVAVLLAVLVMFVVEVARGQDGSPYYQLGALGGVVYAVALLWLRWRR